MEKLNFDDVLDTLGDYGIRISAQALDEISMYFCDNEYSSHRRNFELFQESDGTFLVNLIGTWHETTEVLH